MKLYYSETDILNENDIYEKAYSLLSPCKKERCKNIKANKARISVAGAELLLRFALREEGYFKEIEYTFGKNEKPYLKDEQIFFNISHSQSYVLVAVGNKEMGCDIEKIKTFNTKIAKRFFHPDELRRVKNEADFFEIWTKKESYIKMTGDGLSAGLEKFNVFNLNGEECYFKNWDIDGYKSALCTKEEVLETEPVYIDILSCLS